VLKTILIIGLVVAVLVGGLVTLLTSRSVGNPSGELLERAKKRAREQAQKEDR
jgi:uncharacterized membrane-anchored protein YhcB (DUF1043 family)